jgi:hypothetical protein
MVRQNSEPAKACGEKRLFWLDFFVSFFHPMMDNVITANKEKLKMK